MGNRALDVLAVLKSQIEDGDVIADGVLFNFIAGFLKMLKVRHTTNKHLKTASLALMDACA